MSEHETEAAIAERPAAAAPVAAPAVRPPIVELRKVTQVFTDGTGREFTAIRDVDLRIDDAPGQGEFAAVLGPSGCGKSTVLGLVAGLLFPTKGEVLVGGKPVTRPGPDRGMVFQSYSSMPWLTVLQNVAYGLRLQGMSASERNERARELIERVGLKGHESKYPDELSGGMRQRVAIARTLATKPRIILMDEPFGALDINTRIEMQDLLLRIWQDIEATILFVTHDIGEAVYLADRVLIFSPGPGTITDEIALKLPYPRERAIKNSSLFRRYESELIERIHQLASKSASEARYELTV